MQKLVDSELRYRRLFETAQDGILILNAATGMIDDVNPYLIKMLGYSREEFVKKKLWEVGAFQDIEASKLAFESLQANEYIRYEDLPLRSKEGKLVAVEFVSNVYMAGKDKIIQCNIRDITDRRQTEGKLQTAHELLQNIQDALSAHIAILDHEGTIVQVNTAWINFGKKNGLTSPNHCIGMSYLDVCDAATGTDAKVAAQVANAIRGVRDNIQNETWVEYPCNSETEKRWFIARVTRFDSDGQKWVVVTHEDITDRKQAGEDIRQLNIDLERRVAERTIELVYANQVKDEFLANMSHELRTPLNGILGFAEALTEGVYGELVKRQGFAVRMIHSSGEHLLELINDILDISKIEAGKSDFHLEEVDVNDLCHASMAFIRHLANKKSITVEYTISETDTILVADPRRLKQILINLLNNAVKFTPEKGKVTLEVQADIKECLMRFSVTDTGIGIHPEDIPKLFQPFVQLDGGLSRSYEGSGLGLALVKKMVEMHSGSIEVQSEHGKGSSFTFVVPWEKSMQRRNSHGLFETGTETYDINLGRLARVREKILIAEDNETNVLATRDYLESLGYQVFIARDGREMLAKVEEISPDIILMDIQMPDLNGFDATRRLRTDPRFATLPIIALTAFAMPGDRDRCLEAGMDEYLSKPVKLKELAQTIERLLNSSSGS